MTTLPVSEGRRAAGVMGEGDMKCLECGGLDTVLIGGACLACWQGGGRPPERLSIVDWTLLPRSAGCGRGVAPTEGADSP